MKDIPLTRSKELLTTIKEKDVNRAISILKEVELTKPNIDPILEKYGLKPD